MIDILYDDGVNPHQCPPDNQVHAILALASIELHLPIHMDICIRFATDLAVLELNTQWRDKPSCTDVLSFPQQDGPDFTWEEPLGDIILAVPFTQQEAERLKLPVQQHMLHLIIHGFLHLLGYDHQQDKEAHHMQQLECLVLKQAQLHCPYPELCNA